MALTYTTNHVSTANGVSSSITSGTLSVASGDFITVQCIFADNADASAWTISNNNTAITWTQHVATNTFSNCKVVLFSGTSSGTPPTTVTVTATAGAATVNAKALVVQVHTGQHATTPIPSGNIFSGVGATDVSQSITPTSSGSCLWLVCGDWTAGNSYAAGANCTLVDTQNQTGQFTSAQVRPTTQPRTDANAFSISETDTSGTIAWVAFEVQAAPAASNGTGTGSQGVINVKANNGNASAPVSVSSRISVPWQNISTRAKSLGHFWLDTIAGSPNGTGSGSQGVINIAANGGNASSSKTVSASQGVINVAGNNATASGTAQTSSAQGIINVSANAVSASGTGQASSAQGIVNIAAASGNASTSVNATGSGLQGVVNIVGAVATASGVNNANASSSQGVINISANVATVSATSQVSSAQGAINVVASAATGSGTAQASVTQGTINVVSASGTASTSGNATGSGLQGVINITGAVATASGVSNATASSSQGIINVGAASATANGTTAGNGNATGSQGIINVAANAASVSGTAQASSSQGVININANAVTSSGTALSSAAQGIININANTATANGTTGGNGDASGNQGIISIVANNAVTSPLPSTGQTGGGGVPLSSWLRKQYKEDRAEQKRPVLTLNDVNKKDRELAKLKADQAIKKIQRKLDKDRAKAKELQDSLIDYETIQLMIYLQDLEAQLLESQLEDQEIMRIIAELL